MTRNIITIPSRLRVVMPSSMDQSPPLMVATTGARKITGTAISMGLAACQ
jgi:hypothetical protein